jgi:hypothetical protein
MAKFNEMMRKKATAYLAAFFAARGIWGSLLFVEICLLDLFEVYLLSLFVEICSLKSVCRSPPVELMAANLVFLPIDHQSASIGQPI